MDPEPSSERKWCSNPSKMTREFFDKCNAEGKNPNHFKYGLQKTALIIVCESDEQDVLKPLKIKKLMDFGDIKFNAQDLEGNTALHYACMKRNYAVIQFLLPLVDNSIIENKSGQTPLKLLEAEKKLIEQEVALSTDQSNLVEISRIIDLFQKKLTSTN